MYLENTQSDICLVGRLNYDIQLHEFINSDWARSENDRGSVTWKCFSLRFSTMTWASRKQNSVAINTIEEEYISFCDAYTEAMWLCKLIYGPSDQVLNLTMIY
jgi:hypothetical protein